MSTLPIPSGTYAIDDWHSQLGFSVRHLGISTVRGSFDKYTGSLVVGDDLAATSVTIEAEMGSANTGNPGRDGHLQGEDFFDAANHPTMSFRSTSIADQGDNKFALTGDLTIRGTTKPVTLDVSFNGSGVFPMDQSTHVGFGATGTIKRTDFGVNYGVPLVSENVELNLDLQFVAPATTPAA
jgi:polyisoprenoid-binding protein YceI